jgi:S-methyl-5-thioribose-1-phosphate isomerase
LRREAEETAAEIPLGTAAVEAFAVRKLDTASEATIRMSERGAAFLREASAAGGHAKLRVHTHCNTGSLACLGWGTALGVIRALHESGSLEHVIVDETRPLLQGARLTCWELGQLGIGHYLIGDGAAPFMISQGLADAVVVGADRVAANGDVANKIGTYGLALAARSAGIPFVVAVPESTIDPATPTGRHIPLEQRPEDEITVPAAPAGTRAFNFAFDITPADLVTAIITEERTIIPNEWLGRGSVEHALADSRAQGGVHLPDQDLAGFDGTEATLSGCRKAGSVPRLEPAFRFKVQPAASGVNVNERRVGDGDALARFEPRDVEGGVTVADADRGLVAVARHPRCHHRQPAPEVGRVQLELLVPGCHLGFVRDNPHLDQFHGQVGVRIDGGPVVLLRVPDAAARGHALRQIGIDDAGVAG